MIDPNKSVIIFSHPRSGSTWFQNSLNQYSLGELFNLNLEVLAQNDTVSHKFVKHGYDVERAEEELKNRFLLYDHFESTKKSVSVKIHGAILNNQMINFLKEKNAQYVILERRNKADTFWSLLIGWTINNWHDEIVEREIVVTPDVFKRVIKIVNGIEDSFDIINKNFSTIKIYYEDLLTIPDNEWFTSTKKYKILNGKSIVSILNKQEVNNWLMDAGRKLWIQ